MAIFCLATVIFLACRDLMLPDVRDTEVWLGIEVHGAVARLTAPLHWALYGFGAWAFWTRQPWIWPTATGYAVYVSLSHLIWNLTSPRGGGLFDGLWQLAFFLLAALLIWHLRPARGPRSS